MTLMKSGAVALLAAGLGIACSNPTSDLQTGPKRVLATPQFAVIDSGGTAKVLVQVYDEQGYVLPNAVSFTNTAAVTVAKDPAFRPDLSQKYGAQYIITAVSANTGQVIFTTTGGVADTFDVIVAPPTTLVGAVLSVQNPALGDVVTITAPTGGYSFTAASNIIIPSTTPGEHAPYALVGISPDGSQINFIPGPNASGIVTVDGVKANFAPDLPAIEVQTTTALTTPVLTNVAVNYDNTAPNINDLVTVTAAGYKFLPSVGIDFDGAEQTVVSIAADSSTFTFRAAQAGASGTATIRNLALSFLTTVPLTFPTTATNEVTVGATQTNLTGASDIATAQPLAVPAKGHTSVLNDGGAFSGSGDCTGSPGGANCRVYRLDVAADQTVGVAANWNDLADLGIYFADADGNDLTAAGSFPCDQHGNGATSHPEACSIDLPAGTNYMFVTTFAAFYPPPNNVDPTTINIVLTGQ